MAGRTKKNETAVSSAATIKNSKIASSKSNDSLTNEVKKTRSRKTIRINLQDQGMEWSTDVLTDRAIVSWAAEHSQKKTAAKDIQIYVKLEECMVYYVINGDTGSFAL